MIKAIIQKELRENLKVAVPGLVAFALLAIYASHGYSNMIFSAETGYNRWDSNEAEPLLAPSYLLQMAWLCGVFGALLGWMQINSERHRDLAAFMTHRPLSRSRIFLGKISAGLVMYLVAAGLPVTGFVIWVIQPGHVAAPFEWGMVTPVALLVLAGVAFYFAGIITGIRQARWYASRALGLAMALGPAMLAFGFLSDSGHTWSYLAGSVFCIAILAVAAWGSFVASGRYADQPVAAKGSLTISIFVGVVLVFGLVFSFLVNWLWPYTQPDWISNYVMARDGTVYQEKTFPGQTYYVYGPTGNLVASGQKAEFSDLNGKTVMSETNNEPMGMQEFSLRLSTSSSSGVYFGLKRYSHRYNSDRFFSPVLARSDGVWVFNRTTGRLVQYSLKTRVPVLSLGPGGFVAEPGAARDRFTDDSVAVNWSDDPRRILQTETSVYSANLEKKTLTGLFNSSAGEPVGGVANIGYSNIVVVTRHQVHVMDATGVELASTPYQPAYPDYDRIVVSVLQPLGRFAVWFEPNYLLQRKSNLPTHIVWLGQNGAVTNSIELPALPQFPTKPNPSDQIASTVAPPILMALAFAINPPGDVTWLDIYLSVAGALISAVFTWWLGTRYQIRSGAKLGWTVGALLFNVCALVTFIFVREWPARVKCPHCHALRVVDNEYCEHCGAAFPAASRDGTEIFEPLGVESTVGEIK